MSIERRTRDGIETSYGGVAVRGRDVLVITPAGRRRIVALPKGGPHEGESGAQTAGREVREETGITVEVGERLGEVSYVYRRDGRRIRKTVHFFLMRATGGDPADRDDEMEDVQWFPLERALKRAAYRGEREVLGRAADLLR